MHSSGRKQSPGKGTGPFWVSENQSITKARTTTAFTQELFFKTNHEVSGSRPDSGGCSGYRNPSKGNMSKGTEAELLPQLPLVTNLY